MADDLTNRGRPDRDRINLNEEYEVRDWAKKFGVSEDELRQFALDGLTRRLNIVGVPLDTL
jgi:hypothetical protein